MRGFRLGACGHGSPRDDDEDCFYYHFWSNDVEIAFGYLLSFLPSFNEWRCLHCLSFCR